MIMNATRIIINVTIVSRLSPSAAHTSASCYTLSNTLIRCYTYREYMLSIRNICYIFQLTFIYYCSKQL